MKNKYLRKENTSMIFTLNLPITQERLDITLLSALQEEGHRMTRSELKKLMDEGAILLEGKKLKAGLLCDRVYQVTCHLKEEDFKSFEPENIPLEIIYEDQDLLVINKAKGMVVHPAPGHSSGTLVNALLYHYKDQLSDINGEFRAGIVHRIDKDTSGLLVVAKNNDAHRGLAQQLADHSMYREYYAIVHGNFSEKTGTVDAPIARDPKNRQRMEVVAGGKRAVTHFEVLETFTKTSFLKLKLETGRTHQIRVHMKYIRHPLVGDELYAPKRLHYGIEGQALHASALSFKHPRSEQFLRFEIPLPAYFENLLEGFR